MSGGRNHPEFATSAVAVELDEGTLWLRARAALRWEDRQRRTQPRPDTFLLRSTGEPRWRVETPRIARESRDDVEMEMEHLLSTGSVVVLAERHAVGPEGLLGGSRDPRRGGENRTGQLFRQRVHVTNVPSRHDQRVARIQSQGCNQNENVCRFGHHEGLDRSVDDGAQPAWSTLAGEPAAGSSHRGQLPPFARIDSWSHR